MSPLLNKDSLPLIPTKPKFEKFVTLPQGIYFQPGAATHEAVIKHASQLTGVPVSQIEQNIQKI